MKDLRESVKESLGIRLPEDYAAFIDRYGQKLAEDPVAEPSWIEGLGNLNFMVGTTMAFRERVSGFPQKGVIIAYAGTKLIEKINEEIDVYAMMDTHDSGVYLIDSIGQKEKIADNFSSWISRSLSQARLKEKYKSTLVVIGFEDESKAEAVRAGLFKLQEGKLIDMEDVVVAVRKQDGKVKLSQTHSKTVSGALTGSFTGLLLGALFLTPLLGAALGAAAGAASGAWTDTGLDDRFTRDLAVTLTPGSSALFMLVRRAEELKVLEELSRFPGKVLVTSLSKENEAVLQAALDSAVGKTP